MTSPLRLLLSCLLWAAPGLASHTLTRPDLYDHGRSYTNQFGNVWGTRAANAGAVYGSASLPARFFLDGRPAPALAPGAHDLPAGELAVRYALGTRGEKTVTFAAGAV